jgi:type I restriction enzyme S subunit
MGNEWNECQFEIAPIEIEDGDRGINYPKSNEFTTTGHCIFLNTGNVTQTGFNFSKIDFISHKRDALLRKGKLQRHDVILTTRGTVGNVAYYDETIPFEHIRINSGMVILRSDQSILNSRYLYLFLRSQLFSSQVDSLRTGSAQPQLPIRDIKKVRIRYPDLSEQRAIAHILGTLDDKIELNRQMNATLEAMAQALFQSWFVDFDPVIDNALAAGHPIPDALQERAAARAALGHRRQPLPAAIQSQFPSSFVRHEEMGWVPAGWAVARIGDVLELAYGKSLPATRRLEGSVPVYGSGGISGFHTEHFVNGPGIVVGRKGTVGSLYWVEDNFFPIDTVFFVINKSHTPLYWLYQTLKRIDIKSMGADSAVPGVNRNAVYAKPIIIPNVTAFKGYLAQIEPNNLKRRELEDQIKTLATLRDTLLPKLLSGAVRVAAAG